MNECSHPNVVEQATSGSFWYCPDCKERFYLHPWDHSKHGIYCSPDVCGGPDENIDPSG